MLGWNISITRQNFIRRMIRIPANAKTKRGNFIATWYADCCGLEWLDRLLEEKKIICLQEHFYPGLYTGKAKDILPSIEHMPPCVKKKYIWIEDKETGEHRLLEDGYEFGKSEQEITVCNNEEWLRIEIWDLS